MVPSVFFTLTNYFYFIGCTNDRLSPQSLYIKVQDRSSEVSLINNYVTHMKKQDHKNNKIEEQKNSRAKNGSTDNTLKHVRG